MRTFGQTPPAPTAAEQRAALAAQRQHELDLQRLTGSQQLATQAQQDAAARQQAQLQANQASTAAFHQSMAAGTQASQDFGRGISERSAAWSIQPRPVEAGSSLPLILGLVGGAAVLVVVLVVALKK